MTGKVRTTLVLILSLAAAGAALADAAAGKVKARACAVCHGAMGISSAPDSPSLAGQPERYLVDQLKAYRSGKRQHEVMSVMAKPLTDDDIGDLSAWYSSLVIEVRSP
jgi:cytochrome c553